MKTIVLVSLLPSAAEINRALQSSLRGACLFLKKKKKALNRQMRRGTLKKKRLQISNSQS